MSLPSRSLEQGYEDTQSVESDIDTLFNKFIKPIENIRSIALASAGLLSKDDKDTIRINLSVSTEAVESRAHAFYRLLGLPVVDNSGNCYNPGFNSDRESDSKKDSINTMQDSQIIALMQKRENHIKFLQKTFSNEDTAASIFSLAMGSQPKLFNVFDKSAQTFKVPERDLEVSLIARDNQNLVSEITDARNSFANTPIDTTIDGGIHILKPFQVNPMLEFTVMPSNNLMAAPFLADINATRSSSQPEIIHDRPGLEFIIRTRLQDVVPDPNFLSSLQKILNQEKSPSLTFSADINTDTLRSTLFALADQNNINNIDINSLFQSITSTESQIIKQLIKTIKVVVEQLHISVAEIEKIRDKINFLPIPDKHGPEKLGKIRDTAAIKSLDNQILQLTIKKLNAERQVDIQKGLGNFATPFLNLEKTDTYSEQLIHLTNLRNDLGNLGLEHLRTIEIITGEVSGLGLIDILSIYMALWSIKLEDILGLLDQDSFNRLKKFNPELYSNIDAAQSTVSSNRSSVTSALTTLETRVGNILSFADKLYADSLSSPQESEKGDI